MASFTIDLNNKPDRFGKHKLYLRVTHERKLARSILPYSIPKADFNRLTKSGQWVRRSNPDAEAINIYLNKQINKAREAAISILEKNPNASAEDIVRGIKSQSLSDFFEFAYQQVEELKPINIGNYKKNKTVVDKFRCFVGSDKKLPFDSLTPTLFDQYRNYLATNMGNGQNTIDSNFRNLKAILSKARKMDLYPAGSSVIRTKTPKSKPERSRLTFEEVVRIQNLVIRDDRLLHHVRNAFLFSIYSGGIRIGDLLRLQWSNISGNRLEYFMQKTKKTVSFPISQSAKIILDQYRHESLKPEELVFPFLPDNFYKLDLNGQFYHISSKTAVYNRYLSTLASKIEITKHLSSHTARHTFADLARQGNADLYAISKTLGHSSLAITERYIKGFDQEVVDDVINIVNIGIAGKDNRDNKPTKTQ